MKSITYKLLLAACICLLLISCNNDGNFACNSPYLEYKKGDCCLDANQNKICDSDESSPITGNIVKEASIKVNDLPNNQNTIAPEQRAATKSNTQLPAEENRDINNKNAESAYEIQETKICPFECCIIGDYDVRECNLGYECKANKCIEIDSDGDGLSDNEEFMLSTDPKLPDSDGDGLSDYFEVNVKDTNPNNENTDNDRYSDKDDPEPLKTNTALIRISTQSYAPSLSELVLDYKKYGLDAIEHILSGTREVIFTISNEGDDYTNFISFDFALSLIITDHKLNGEICSAKKDLDPVQLEIQHFGYFEKIMPGQTITKDENIQLTSYKANLILPEDCQDNPEECPCTYKFMHKIENVNFDLFPPGRTP
ncbi:MAG: hypothetical protein ABIJ34_04215 [archaeon]